MKNVVLRLSC